MSQRKFAFVAIGIISGLVVAIVKTQEFSQSAYADQNASGARAVPAPRRQATLVDRLRSVRESSNTQYPTAKPAAEPAKLGTIRVDSQNGAASLQGGGFKPAPATPMPVHVDSGKPAWTSNALTDSKSPPTGPRYQTAERKIPSVVARPLQGEPAKAAPSATPVPSKLPTGAWKTQSSRRRVPEDKPAQSPYAPPAPTSVTAKAPAAAGIDIVSKSPIIHVEYRGPDAITIGKEAPYSVRVHNLGGQEARGVKVALQIPAWVRVADSQGTQGDVDRQDAAFPDAQLVWSVGQIESRGKAELSLKLIASESRPFDLNVQWRTAPRAATARVQVQEPKLQIALSGPSEVQYGDTASYAVTVSNPGTGTAEDVVIKLSDVLGGNEITVGDLAAGALQQLDVSLMAEDAGEIEAHVAAVASGGLQAEAKQKVIVRRAVLEVATTGPKFQYAGSIATYKVTIANTGDATAEDVLAAVALPSGAEYISGIEDGDAAEGGVRWTVGELVAGDKRDFEIHCKLLQAGENRFEAGARAAGNLSAADAAATTVEALADLDLAVSDPSGPKPVGEEVTYEVHVRNRGTKAARDVRIFAQFSDGIEPVATHGAKAAIKPGQAIFHPIDRIEAGAEIKVVVTAKADQPGNRVFRVEVRCNDPETKRILEGTTRFYGSEQRTSKLQQASPAVER